MRRRADQRTHRIVAPVGAALAAHRFWEADAATFNNQLNNFLKDIAGIGGCMTAGLEALASQRRRDAA